MVVKVPRRGGRESHIVVVLVNKGQSSSSSSCLRHTYRLYNPQPLQVLVSKILVSVGYHFRLFAVGLGKFMFQQYKLH